METFNLKTESDIFSTPAVQNTIEEGYFQEYRPITPLNDDSPIEFLIPPQTLEYLDLSLTILHLKIQITKSNGDALDDDISNDVVAPINNVLHSLFGNVQLFLNKKCISSYNHYHYKAYMENLLNYGSDAKRTHLGSEIWEKDSSSYMDSMKKSENRGFHSRHVMFSKSQIVDLEGILHCDIFNQNKHMLNGVELMLKLQRNKNSLCLMSASVSDYKMSIKEAYLTIRKLRYNPSVLIAHAKTLLHTTAKYSISRVEIKAITIPTFVQSKTLDGFPSGF